LPLPIDTSTCRSAVTISSAVYFRFAIPGSLGCQLLLTHQLVQNSPGRPPGRTEKSDSFQNGKDRIQPHAKGAGLRFESCSIIYATATRSFCVARMSLTCYKGINCARICVHRIRNTSRETGR
jgi:hypothetical protein